MKNPNIMVRGKDVVRRDPPLIATALVIAVTLMIGNQSYADGFPFRVVYANVPGAAEIERGNIQTGITILQDQLSQVEQGDSSDIWATLCGAYIVNASLDQAQRACTKAVEIAPTYSAFNNRGVLRVFKGDLSGAREDFERVRPRQMEAYLEELTTKDVRVVGADNFGLVNKLLARQRAAGVNAELEDMTTNIVAF